MKVDASGTVSLLTLLPFQEADAPPFLGMPPGSKLPVQPVPTSVVQDNSGNLLASELTGFPFPVGGANVYKLAADGTLYVVEIASNGLLSDRADLQAQLIEIRPDGTRKVLLNQDDGLITPSGVAIGPDGMVYVTNCTLCGPGQGTVLRVDPSVARDPATADACSPDVVPGTPFTDIGTNFHREAIECLSFWNVVGGKTDTTFDPQGTITRGQLATMVAQALEASGVTLPDNPPNAFSDDDQSVHAHHIDQLAALGVVTGFGDGKFHPDDPVARQQVAAMLVRAYAKAAGHALASGPDAFDDDKGSALEADINAAALAGWINGVGPRAFNPAGSATRGQAASMVARMLSTLVHEGVATVPAAG